MGDKPSQGNRPRPSTQAGPSSSSAGRHQGTAFFKLVDRLYASQSELAGQPMKVENDMLFSSQPTTSSPYGTGSGKSPDLSYMPPASPSRPSTWAGLFKPTSKKSSGPASTMLHGEKSGLWQNKSARGESNKSTRGESADQAMLHHYEPGQRPLPKRVASLRPRRQPASIGFNQSRGPSPLSGQSSAASHSGKGKGKASAHDVRNEGLDHRTNLTVANASGSMADAFGLLKEGLFRETFAMEAAKFAMTAPPTDALTPGLAACYSIALNQTEINLLHEFIRLIREKKVKVPAHLIQAPTQTQQASRDGPWRSQQQAESSHQSTSIVPKESAPSSSSSPIPLAGTEPLAPNHGGSWTNSKTWIRDAERVRIAFNKMRERARHLRCDRSPFLPQDPVEYAGFEAEVKAAGARQLCRKMGMRKMQKYERSIPKGLTVVFEPWDGLSLVLSRENCFNAITPGLVPWAERVEWPHVAELKHMAEQGRMSGHARSSFLPPPRKNTLDPRAFIGNVDLENIPFEYKIVVPPSWNLNLPSAPREADLASPAGLTEEELHPALRGLLDAIDAFVDETDNASWEAWA